MLKVLCCSAVPACWLCVDPHKSRTRVSRRGVLCSVGSILAFFCFAPPCGLGVTASLFLYRMPVVAPIARDS